MEDRLVLSATLQVIHNSPYQEAAAFDVYVNDALTLVDVAFRDATGFLELPSDKASKIDIRGADALPSNDPAYSATVSLEAGISYVGLAMRDPLNRAGEPAFGIALSNLGREAAETPTNAELLVFHGAPDAPAVDVLARGVGSLVSDLPFPEFAGEYVSVPPASYIVDLTPVRRRCSID